MCNRLKYVPKVPTNPPNISNKREVELNPARRIAKSPGKTKEIMVPVAQPKRFRTSPNEGADRANATVTPHKAIVTTQ